jgi:hexosaminidase
MNRSLRIVCLLSLLISAACDAAPDSTSAKLSLVPLPARVDRLPGKFTINAATSVVVDKKSAALNDVAAFLAAQLRQSTGYRVPLVTGADVKGLKNAILLSTALVGKPTVEEGYELSVTPKFIRLTGSQPAGIFRGMQTLFQLLPEAFDETVPVSGVTWDVPAVWIEDSPRFAWRGMHLDVGRHFAPKEFVKKYIDLISRYKFNVFHWHLTEDQGWRIEIKKYPKLTTVGAWRSETMGDGQPYGGFYTQEEVKEVVEYARQRFVTVVPEIEMPGHAKGALAAYPQFSCTGGPIQVESHWRVFDDVFCAGNDSTFTFLQDILDEVVPLFPGTFFHVGGDECPKARWHACPKCQARIKAEGLKNEHELQSYFIRRMESYLASKGKRLIGWDEILEGGLAPNATVMSWRGMEGGIAAARQNHDVVMAPTNYVYLDYYQGLTGEPTAIGGYLPIDTVYAFEPVPADLNEQEAKHILGGQGNIWREYISTNEQTEYMAFPRACALAEVLWTVKAKRDFASFAGRLENQVSRLEARGVNVRIPTAIGFDGSRTFTSDTSVTVNFPYPVGVLHYTLDGTDPNASSPQVNGPVPVHGWTVLKVRTVYPDGRMSRISTGWYSVIDPAVNGLSYAVYEGAFTTPEELASRTPVSEGKVQHLDLGGIPDPAGPKTVRLSGVLRVMKAGLYRWKLITEERASLSIDGMRIACDTIPEWWVAAKGASVLRAGDHTIELLYSRPANGGWFDCKVEGPGLELQEVPAVMLRKKM